MNHKYPCLIDGDCFYGLYDEGTGYSICVRGDVFLTVPYINGENNGYCAKVTALEFIKPLFDVVKYCKADINNLNDLLFKGFYLEED